jgi:hypothetical protein
VAQQVFMLVRGQPAEGHGLYGSKRIHRLTSPGVVSFASFMA